MSHNNAVLTIENMCFSYRDHVVFDTLNASIFPGDFIGVTGPNGSGKSTLLKLLNGLLTPISGEIRCDGIPLRTLKPRRIAQKIAFVPQQTAFANTFSVMDIVLMGRFPHQRVLGFESREDVDIARSMLQLTGSQELETRMFEELSGGEKQRVILASALAQEPDVLILDEPLTGLDIFYQLHILSILAEFNTKRELTVITALHDVNLAAAFCKRIWLLNPPDALRDGHPNDILTPDILKSVFHVAMHRVEIPGSAQWLIPDLTETTP